MDQTPSGPSPLSLDSQLGSMSHRYEKPLLTDTLEVVLAGLLAQPDLTVCTYRGAQSCRLEGQERQTALTTFLEARRSTERRRNVPYLYVLADEIDLICKAAGWQIPPMFPLRLAGSERDRKLDAQTRVSILQAAGLATGSDPGDTLLNDIETAVNWYRREPLFKEGLPTKPQARSEVLAIVESCASLREALEDLHDGLRHQLESLMRADWERELDALGPLLWALASSSFELKARIEVRMPGAEAGRPDDEAAFLLAREVAGALQKAGIKVTATRGGRFEKILRHALLSGGAGGNDNRVHRLAGHAVANLKAQSHTGETRHTDDQQDC